MGDTAKNYPPLPKCFRNVPLYHTLAISKSIHAPTLYDRLSEVLATWGQCALHLSFSALTSKNLLHGRKELYVVLFLGTCRSVAECLKRGQ